MRNPTFFSTRILLAFTVFALGVGESATGTLAFADPSPPPSVTTTLNVPTTTTTVTNPTTTSSTSTSSTTTTTLCDTGGFVCLATAFDGTALFQGNMKKGSAAVAYVPSGSVTGDTVVSNSSSNSFGGGSGDQVTYSIELPAGGDWYAWARLFYPGNLPNDANSFRLQVDAGPNGVLGNNKDYLGLGAPAGWHWDGNGAVGVAETGPVVPLYVGSLSAGPNVVLLEKREVKKGGGKSGLVPPHVEIVCFTQNSDATPPTDAQALAAIATCPVPTTTTTTTSTTLNVPTTTTTTTSTTLNVPTTTTTTSTSLPPECSNNDDCAPLSFVVGVECQDDVCVAGVCTQVPSAASTPCGDQDDTECDNPDTCDGAGSCVQNYEILMSPCGNSGDQCTSPQECDGAGMCTDGPTKEGDSCDDGDSTTESDTCVAGACIGTPVEE